jgi:hypothetical protein
MLFLTLDFKGEMKYFQVRRYIGMIKIQNKTKLIRGNKNFINQLIL